MGDLIEGELVDSAGAVVEPGAIRPPERSTENTVLAVRNGTDQVQIFNPLDADPELFAIKLKQRSDNYDTLAMHLRSIMIPGKDIGRIHIEKSTKRGGKCEAPWNCTPEKEPRHWSPWTLFSPGADKVLGVLGLAVSYPDEQDYRRAILRGYDIQEVITKAFIDNGRGQIISEGGGSASRKQENGDLNRTIKKAQKRARVDAVMRLPGLSALFEEDYLAELAKKAAGNSTTSRARTVSPQFTTGAVLQVWPMKGNLEGQRFDEMEDSALEWILRTINDKPDIRAAAEREMERRENTTESGQGRPSETSGAGDARSGAEPAQHTMDDFFDEYSNMTRSEE